MNGPVWGILGWLLGGLAVLLGLVLLVRFAFRWYVRWFLRRTVLQDSPSFQVTVVDSEPGTVRVALELRGSSGAMGVNCLSAPEKSARAVGLRAPDGFEPYDEPSDEKGATLWWRPRTSLKVRPGEPLELTFGYDPDARDVVAVFGQAEARVGLGGTGTGFTVLVGPRDPLEIRAANLRSALYARAREEGEVPRRLPEWAELEELEARLPAGEKGPGSRLATENPETP